MKEIGTTLAIRFRRNDPGAGPGFPKTSDAYRRDAMNQRFLTLSFRVVRTMFLLFAVVIAVRAQDDDQDEYMGENPERYAQVKVLEGDVQIRKGEGEEALERGTPVSEGDVVESHGRGVLQLGDGSKIAFGGNTRFQVAALFMDKDSQQQILIRLDYGRLRANLGADSNAQFRIDTPSGSGTLGDRCSASFEVAQDRTTRVRVHTGRLTFSNEDNRTSISAGERLTVYSNHDQLDRVRNFNTYDFDDFDTWSDRHLSTRHGESYSKVPTEIRYYADDLDGAGEWVYVDDYSTWCWRPIGLSVDWRPYWDGHWGCYAGGMTWISAQPWGYVTHHFGRWGWRANWGWYWIPGVYYAPAWVAWHSYDSYFGWAPLGYYNDPCTWGHRGWGGGHCWNIVPVNYVNSRQIHNHIYNDPGTIQRFNPRTAGPGWLNPNGHRPISTPWRRGPLVVHNQEFRNPSLIQRVVQDQGTFRQRINTYGQQARESTGRQVYFRERGLPRPSTATGSPSPVAEMKNRSFEDRSRLRPAGRVTTPMNRPNANGGVVPPHRSPANDRPNQSERVSPRNPQDSPRPSTTTEAPRRDWTRERPRAEERPQPMRETPRREAPREERRPAERPRENDQRPQRQEPSSRPPSYSRPAERPSSPPPSYSRPAERPSSPHASSPAPASRPSSPPPSSSRENQKR